MRLLRSRLATSIVIAVAVTALAWAGLAVSAFNGVQRRRIDQLFPSIGPDPRIVVVAIDEATLGSVHAWPWSRSIHARLIRSLQEQSPALIGYDALFLEPSDPAEDHELATAIREAGNVVMASTGSFNSRPGLVPRAYEVLRPVPELAAAAAGQGHANVYPDPDGIVRAVAPLIESPDGEFLPAFSLTLLRLLTADEGQVIVRPRTIQLDKTFIATGPAHLMEVNFARGFRTISAGDILAGRVPAGSLRGRIVLVGAAARGLTDRQNTPLERSAGEPGVMLHANALNTMLQGAYLFPESRARSLADVFVLALTLALAVGFLRVWISPGVLVAAAGGFLWFASGRFDAGTVVNVVYPLAGGVVSYGAALATRYVSESRERRRVTGIFGRYLAPDVVDEVLAAPEDAIATLTGVSRPISVLFADLRGFTSASEQLDPTDVVQALNVFLDAMTRAVVEERGTVDKFMGDCVMAFWGAPREAPDHAVRAVRAGLRMQQLIAEAMADGRVSQLAVRGCGVGVATGSAVVGNIGSHQRLDYTVIGDTVNTASRLCGVAEPYEVIVTRATAEAVEHEFRLDLLPPMKVKGKATELEVFLVSERAPSEQARPAEALQGQLRTLEAPPKAAGYAPVEPVPDAKSDSTS